MKFVLECQNEDCGLYKAVSFTPGKYRMKYNRTTKKMVPELCEVPYHCPECGHQLVFTEIDSVIPEFSVNDFASLPDEKKKEVLKKRYEAGMKHGGNDEGEMRKREAISKMIGYGK